MKLKQSVSSFVGAQHCKSAAMFIFLYFPDVCLHLSPWIWRVYILKTSGKTIFDSSFTFDFRLKASDVTWAETPLLLLLLPGSCCSRSYEPSDKRVYLIHILINMEPHFLLLRALGEDIIHQALSRAERFLFTQPTALFHALPWLSLTLCSSLCPTPYLSLPVILHIIRACGRWLL